MGVHTARGVHGYIGGVTGFTMLRHVGGSGMLADRHWLLDLVN